ncbi:Copia-type pol Polyprotein [Phytophthora megakarya]|uniref:Copia-type pol Polyprotein n=1 Tax=Phytophthora megakarya TaxID=4795 RepID=A0A225VR95_9STRA|nr:Copia-type pol Polyprotein [Phytophthora megakarya]
MWKSQRQRRVTQDTFGLRLVACCECTKMTMWARELMLELGFGDQLQHVPLNCDNQSTIAVVACNGNTSSVRHIAKQALFINEYKQKN